LLCQLVFLQHVAKAQDADPVGDALYAGETRKLPVQRGLEEGFLHDQVRQVEPLLQEMNAQHRCQFKRRAPCLGSWCVRRNERQQFRPRHHQVHLVEKHGFARAPRTQIQAKFLLGLTPLSLPVPDHAIRA
jgi:hypothetical protein